MHCFSSVILLWKFSSFQPRMGAVETIPAIVQTDAISIPIERDDRDVTYCTLVTAQYLSRAMATRWRMEAVQDSTSMHVQKSQSTGPKIQLPVTSLIAPIGMTRHATVRSAIASERTR